LLYEMDGAGVDQAVVVCAITDRNPDNNEYVAEQVLKHPSRIHQFPDVDSHLTEDYHTPGAADRLRRMAERWPVKGFIHRLKGEEDGAWLYSEEGLEFFMAASEKRLIANIGCGPHQQAALRRVAEKFPSLPFVCNHMGWVRASEGPSSAGLKEVLASAKLPNIHIKVSGFNYGARLNWEYPYADVQWVVRVLYEHFGPDRLFWGSNYPPSRGAMTYRQTLEAFRTHCIFVPEEDKAPILGGSLERLLAGEQVLSP
jgi:predicted TIM-barrel fold metal-dependent hydrolase